MSNQQVLDQELEEETQNNAPGRARRIFDNTIFSLTGAGLGSLAYLLSQDNFMYAAGNTLTSEPGDALNLGLAALVGLAAGWPLKKGLEGLGFGIDKAYEFICKKLGKDATIVDGSETNARRGMQRSYLGFFGLAMAVATPSLAMNRYLYGAGETENAMDSVIQFLGERYVTEDVERVLVDRPRRNAILLRAPVKLTTPELPEDFPMPPNSSRDFADWRKTFDDWVVRTECGGDPILLCEAETYATRSGTYRGKLVHNIRLQSTTDTGVHQFVVYDGKVVDAHIQDEEVSTGLDGYREVKITDAGIFVLSTFYPMGKREYKKTFVRDVESGAVFGPFKGSRARISWWKLEADGYDTIAQPTISLRGGYRGGFGPRKRIKWGQPKSQKFVE